MKGSPATSIRDFSSWELASMLGSAMGLPAMAVGGELSSTFGPGNALVSIIVGNLLLWGVGLGIVSMSRNRNDAIQNIRGYLGKISGLVAACILVFVFLVWYSIQIKGASVPISTWVIQASLPSKTLLVGIFLGLLTAFLAVGGIRFISRFCLYALPILILFVGYLLYSSNQPISFRGSWGFSFFGTISVISIWLPGIVNLPTFFRHSCSRADAFFSLSLIALIHIFFEVSAVFLGLNKPTEILIDIGSRCGLFCYSFFVFFIVLLYCCINLINIYYASAGWDAFFSRYWGRAKLFFIGCIGTVSYFILEKISLIFLSPMEYLETIITSFISILGVVLLIDYLIAIIVRHRPRFFEKFWSAVCWVIGCYTVVQSYQNTDSSASLAFGISASLLAFLVIIFVEETVWSIKNLKRP